MRGFLKSGLVAIFLLASFSTALFGLELFSTTGGLIKSAPYVAHVRVEHVVARGPLRDCTVTVLDNLKGALPSSIQVRILIPRGRAGALDAEGSEWILILGNKNSSGMYTLRSLEWGQIAIYEDKETGKKILTKPMNGLEPKAQNGQYYSLERFKELVRELTK